MLGYLNILYFLFVLFFLGNLIYILFLKRKLELSKNTFKGKLPFLSVIVPVRNEELNIAKCLNGILHQDYNGKYEVIIANDNSTDKTREIVLEFQKKNSNKIKLLDVPVLPKGWVGKTHACFGASKLAKGDYLIFIDADTYAMPGMLTVSVSYAIKNSIDLLTLNPFQLMVSFSERLVMPWIFLILAFSMKFKRVNDPFLSDAIGNGQFMMFKKETYHRIGGHACVKNIIQEDIELSKIIKENGYKLFWGFGDNILHTRMYFDFKGIWEGLKKNLVTILRLKNPWQFMVFGLYPILLGIFPLALPFLILQNSSSLLEMNSVLIFSSLLVILSSYMSAIITFKIPIHYAIFFPIGFLYYLALYFASIYGEFTGRKVWKGREYNI